MKNHPLLKIIFKNTFTLFNLVNIFLAILVASVGSFKNMLFIFIAVANTLIGIFNEFRAYKIVSKLRLLSEQRPTVERDGRPVQIGRDEVKVGDILLLGLGDQIPFDSVMLSGSLEVNESFITGEQDNIIKHIGDPLTSGSFVVSGSARVKVQHVGDDNFLAKLESSASNIKTADSKLFSIMNSIVKYISYALIPIGALLLWSRFRIPDTTTETAITSTVAALINMIPEGLILLTSSVLALATVRLSKKQVLVQDLYAIETLARVDCIALDKTGTLTTGKMTVKGLVLPHSSEILEITPELLDSSLKNTPTFPAASQISPEITLASAIELILTHSSSSNATSSALKNTFPLYHSKIEDVRSSESSSRVILLAEGARSSERSESKNSSELSSHVILSERSESKNPFSEIPFSSDRKYSGLRFETGELLMGAPQFLLDHTPDFIDSLSTDYRVLAVVEKTDRTTLLGFVLLEDEIRPNASEIINYFDDNNIAVKIISGDGLSTVKAIAARVGVKDLRAVDLSTVPKKNYASLVKNYAIFTRVKPAEKKALLAALKKQGNTVAMTGDGVNDILAMKEADCSIAIGDGSDAARRVAKIVLLDSDFSAVPSIIAEGRQSVNNLERSTVLFLTKTVYAAILAVIFVFLPFEYPFSPIEMSLLNCLCIGLPGFVLALEPNTARIKDQFLINIKKYSLPTGILISLAVVILTIVAANLNFLRSETLFFSAIVTFTLNFVLLYRISRPLNKFRIALLGSILLIFILALALPFTRSFFFA